LQRWLHSSRDTNVAGDGDVIIGVDLVVKVGKSRGKAVLKLMIFLIF